MLYDALAINNTMEKKKFTIRQLDLLNDALSSYLLEVDGYSDTGMKDEVFDIIEMVGAYRMHRIKQDYQQSENKGTLDDVPYSSIEEYFDFDLGLVYNENVEDVTDDPKEWDKFWSTVDDEDGQPNV